MMVMADAPSEAQGPRRWMSLVKTVLPVLGIVALVAWSKNNVDYERRQHEASKRLAAEWTRQDALGYSLEAKKFLNAGFDGSPNYLNQEFEEAWRCSIEEKCAERLFEVLAVDPSGLANEDQVTITDVIMPRLKVMSRREFINTGSAEAAAGYVVEALPQFRVALSEILTVEKKARDGAKVPEN